DHLGSSSVITDSIGNSAQQLYYYPYGEIKTNTGSDITKHKFTDQEYDAETGLYYYGARYYDPKLARFISADTIVPDPINPQSLNRYSYVLNNPLRYIDPTGHGFWQTLLGVVEVVVGAVIAIVGSIYNPYVAAAGIALMAYGVETLGGNVNISTSTQVASFGGGGGGGPGSSSWITYTGPGSRDHWLPPSRHTPLNGSYSWDSDLYLVAILRRFDHDYNVNTISSLINAGMYPNRDYYSWAVYYRGDMILEEGIEANPLIDPIPPFGGIGGKAIKGIKLLKPSARLRIKGNKITRMMNSLKVKPKISITDVIPVNPEKIIIRDPFIPDYEIICSGKVCSIENRGFIERLR
ncbi:MAG: RHS repeat-associated core domain-containing protein, partial [Thermodesulfovibrionia bacterium]|nr:RHS repeat-associated core domain-containing protein [Thermodesulfovibrionia bacterium]